MRIGLFEHGVEVAQPVAHLACDGGILQVVQDGFVVLVHQHHRRLTLLLVRLGDQVSEVIGHILGVDVRRTRQAQRRTVVPQVAADAPIQLRPAMQHTVAKTNVDDRAPPCPIPAMFRDQPFEQLGVGFKQLFEGVHQQAFTDTTGAAQKKGLARFDQVHSQT